MTPPKTPQKRGPKVKLTEGFTLVTFRCPPDLYYRLETARGLTDRSTFLRDLLGKTLP